MLEMIKNFFDSYSFMPHGHCYLWQPEILWLNVGSDILIALSYYVIPGFLVYFVRKRTDLAFNWIFIMFALFILACGSTHLMDIWTVWNPDYGLQGLIKLFTAVISVATAIALIPLMPKALSLPSFSQMEHAHQELRRLNEELKNTNMNLEERVQEKIRDISTLVSIVEHSNDAIIGKDLNNCINFWNLAAERLYGYRADEIMGKSIYTLIPKNLHEEFSQLMNKVYSGITTESIETLRLNRDGKEINISVGISPVKDGSGRIIGSSHIARDITLKKQSEEELKASEARKSAILNASLEAIITMDAYGKIIEWNQMAEKTFGFEAMEVLGKEMPEFIIPERYRSAHHEGVSRFLKSGVATVIGKRSELIAKKKDGSEFPIEISIAVIPSDKGLPIFTASIRDITHRLKSEEELKLNEERFRSVIEAAPNGLIMVDQKGIITLCNAEVETLFGFPRSELVGSKIEILVPEGFRKNHADYVQGFFKNPENRQMGAGRDLYGRRKDGSEFSIEIGLSPILINNNTFVLASIVDITKRKNLEDQLRHYNRVMEQKNHEMEQFVYSVSHDLKSPLVTSSGFLGLLKEDLQANNYNMAMDSISRLEKANARMSQLIDDLLQLSRVGRIKMEIERIDMTSLIDNICENLSTQINEKKVKMLVAREMYLPQGDRKRIYQVFENLIINALKYACDVENPVIEIGCQMQQKEICFYVKDNGPGIPKEYHGKIFGLFQRLESDNRGTGVGLTIVSRIMQVHEGRVWVESNLGQGTTFWLAFPYKISPSRGGAYGH